MWPFKKPPIPDTVTTIFITPDGAMGFPLEPDDPTLYDKDLEKIKDILRMWITQDIAFASQKGIKIEGTMVYQLMNIDIKYLPYPTNLTVLMKCLKDPAGSFSGSRLMDAFNRIYIYTSVNTHQVVTGRFLYGMIYGLGQTINDVALPAKSDWIQVLKGLPWVPYLEFIQELYDEDDAVSKVVAMHGRSYAQDTTIATANRNMGGGAPNTTPVSSA